MHLLLILTASLSLAILVSAAHFVGEDMRLREKKDLFIMEIPMCHLLTPQIFHSRDKGTKAAFAGRCCCALGLCSRGFVENQ